MAGIAARSGGPPGPSRPGWLRLGQSAPDGLVEPAVRPEKRPCVDATAALEVGRAPACLLDEEHRRRGVPGRQLDLDHRLTGALGDQRVAPEVAEPAFPPHV